MKTMEIPKGFEPLIEFAERAEQNTLVLTDKKRPVAALVSVRSVDRESLALSTNPEFSKIIERAREEIRAGKTTALETLEKELGASRPVKRRRKTSQR